MGCYSLFDQTIFIRIEDANFALFNYVTEMNNQVETLQDSIAKLKQDIKEARERGEEKERQQREKLEQMEKLSSPRVNHSDCPASKLLNAKNSPSLSTDAGFSPFHGFSSTAASTAADPDPLFRYIQANDPETGLGVSPGIIQCGEQVPTPPPGTHIHHMYMDDVACLHGEGTAYNYKEVGPAVDDNDDFSNGI